MTFPPVPTGCDRVACGSAGYLDYRIGSGTTVEIFDVAVDSAERRKGVGRDLLERLFAAVGPDTYLVYAITRADNRIAQEFYEHCQFRVVGVLRDFYREEWRVDAILYGRSPGGPV